MTPLPLPGVRKRLQAWLEKDWAAGVHNVNQVLAYTLQFIPAVGAVNTVLGRMPQERLLPAVAELARAPYDWTLIRFGSASLGKAIGRAAAAGGMLRSKFRLPDLRLDTPARATCAGFWYLHEKEPGKAAEAFERVRALPYGEEMYGIAASLAAALEVRTPEEIAAWRERAVLPQAPGTPLRPETLTVLRQLEEVSGEVHTARRAVSPALRSSALGRAVGALTRLLDTAGGTCPQPEAALVLDVAARWRDTLARWGEEVGKEVLLRPVENPFAEGAGGRPVSKTFVGRTEVLERLERWWSGRSDAPLPVIILYGHRRMGKSSILLRLYEKRPPHLLVARADMQDLIAADHTGQLLQKLAQAVYQTAGQGRLDPGPPPQAADYATFGLASIAFDALLEKLAPQMAGRRLILTIDEYELAEEKIEVGKFDPDFLRYLRGALNRHLWFNLILAGRKRLEEELRHYHAVFFGAAEPVLVTFLNRGEAIRLIRRPTDDFTLDIEEASAEAIYRLTGGQPYLIQRLCYELVERWNDRFLREAEKTPRRLTLEDFQTMLTGRFLRDFFLAADYYFSGVWEEAGPDGRKILRALAGSKEKAVAREALLSAAGLGPEAGEKAFQTLLAHDLVRETEGKVRFAVPLMCRWLEMVQPDS